jgi:predicted O-methyltransferase YrrM
MIDTAFLAGVASLLRPGMGTENTSWLLYSLLRMMRPRTVLEVGTGYTTPFLLRALADNVAEAAEDRRLLALGNAGDDLEYDRASILNPLWYAKPHTPRLVAIDDLSGPTSTAPRVLEVIRGLGLDSHLRLYQGDFRGRAAEIGAEFGALDFIWFDCGGPAEYVEFLQEYWPLINPDGGCIALHFTYHRWGGEATRRDGSKQPIEVLLPGSILNEIKRQEALSGPPPTFEVLSLVEPHKVRQGSVTLVRRLAPLSRRRDSDFGDEMTRLMGAPFDGRFTLR